MKGYTPKGFFYFSEIKDNHKLFLLDDCRETFTFEGDLRDKIFKVVHRKDNILYVNISPLYCSVDNLTKIIGITIINDCNATDEEINKWLLKAEWYNREIAQKKYFEKQKKNLDFLLLQMAKIAHDKLQEMNESEAFPRNWVYSKEDEHLGAVAALNITCSDNIYSFREFELKTELKKIVQRMVEYKDNQ